VRFVIKIGQNAKIREKVLRSADMWYSVGRHPSAAGAELKILIFGAGGSSIRPLGTIRVILLGALVGHSPPMYRSKRGVRARQNDWVHFRLIQNKLQYSDPRGTTMDFDWFILIFPQQPPWTWTLLHTP